MSFTTIFKSAKFTCAYHDPTILISKTILYTFPQEKTLDQLQASNPKGRFWFKIDGTDVKDCLLESGKGEWNGDIDLLDGKLQEKRSMYDHRREICTKLMKNNGTFQRRELQEYLTEIIDNLETKDKPFLLDGLQNARVTYQTKFNAPNTSEETLKNLNWEIVEFRTIAEQCQTFKATLEDILADLQPTQNDSLPAVKIQLRQVHDNYKTYLRNLYKKLRQPSATHVLVFMLSDERRNRKPYALPVMYVPYYSLNDAYLRDLSKIIKLGMKSRHLELTGTCTDGEFCTLRTQGEVRMLHIWQCIHDARESVSKMSRTTLLEMLLLVNSKCLSRNTAHFEEYSKVLHRRNLF